MDTNPHSIYGDENSEQYYSTDRKFVQVKPVTLKKILITCHTVTSFSTKSEELEKAYRYEGIPEWSSGCLSYT